MNKAGIGASVLMLGSIVNAGLSIATGILNSALQKLAGQYTEECNTLVALQSSINSNMTFAYAYDAFLQKFKYDLVQYSNVEFSARCEYQQFKEFTFDTNFVTTALDGLRETLKFFGLLMTYKINTQKAADKQAVGVVNQFDKNKAISKSDKDILKDSAAVVLAVQKGIQAVLDLIESVQDITELASKTGAVQEEIDKLTAAISELKGVALVHEQAAAEIEMQLEQIARTFEVEATYKNRYELLYAVENALTQNTSPAFREFDDHTLRGIKKGFGSSTTGDQLDDILTFKDSDELLYDLGLYFDDGIKISTRAYDWFRTNVFVKNDNVLWDATSKYLTFCNSYYSTNDFPQNNKFYLCIQIKKAPSLLDVTTIASVYALDDSYIDPNDI